ncbi:MAG: hypothetical protein IH935_12010, partial [Acidobacteria bacterium]|nr:hypothetical protein [Acidobacteriota bacterium]
VTNTCGELQRLRKAVGVLGTRTDLQIFASLAAAMGATLHPSQPEEALEEIRQMVPEYNIPLANVLAGGAEAVLSPNGFQPLAAPAETSGRVYSAQDTLFTSGTLGRFSNILNLVPERNIRKEPGPA